MTTSLQDILSAFQNPTPSSRLIIEKAYHFSEEAHKEQQRKSGEPYFIHPAAIALSLAKLGMDAATIAAGLLHDTIEDGATTEEQIQKEFGDEIYFLVDGVTKLGKLRYHGLERHAESLRRLLIATSKDIRVIIIKLMDRMHNMQTLEHVKPEKQERIARETLEIYAPLANRLGMGSIKRDLEDLAFPYVDPKKYEEARKIIQLKQSEINDLMKKVSHKVKKELALAGITDFHTQIRIKGFYALWKKLERKDGDLSKIYDIVALRIIVPTVDECYQVLKVVHGQWKPIPGRIKDYIALAKPNGYQSIHTTILIGDGTSVEVQIRTEEMDREAEFGVAAHASYKQLGGKASADAFAKLSTTWLKHLAPTIQETSSKESDAQTAVPRWLKDVKNVSLSSEEFLEDLKEDFFSHRIFVFTPKGDTIDLPVGSTGIDFAYSIHSWLGDHLNGVKVNGKLVSIETDLQNGNVVEIMTKESAHPTIKWLDFTQTSLAKRHIRAATDTPAINKDRKPRIRKTQLSVKPLKGKGKARMSKKKPTT